MFHFRDAPVESFLIEDGGSFQFLRVSCAVKFVQEIACRTLCGHQN